MKFLVLALCVCAASAAPPTPFGRTYTPYKPQQQVKAFAQSVPAYVPTPVVEAANTAYAAAQVVAEAPVVAAKAAYNQAKTTYNQAYVKDAEAQIVRANSEVNPDGFDFSYETDNKIAAQAVGTTRRVGDENVLVIQGSYRYVDPEGKEVVVSYVADENGFQPSSDILPVGPEIPEAIARSLEYLRTHAPVVKESY